MSEEAPNRDWSLEEEDEDGAPAGHEILYVVPDEEDGDRLDRNVADHLEVSRTRAQQWIDVGHVTVAAVTARTGSQKVRAGQSVHVTVPAPTALDVVGENIPLVVVYEDDDVIVIDKPRGMVVHPAGGHASGTLVNALLGRQTRLSGIGGVLRPGIVHRIDKDTSGLLVVAKSDLAHQSLSAQFKAHSIQRVYEALVHGVVAPSTGTIDAAIGRDPRDRKRMAVVPDDEGRRAVTHFRVLERFAEYTYLELRLETGRTHQIRVHLSYIGHPVAGDPVYARKDPLRLEGQALHAKVLGFAHPRTGEPLLFTASVPPSLQRARDSLR